MPWCRPCSPHRAPGSGSACRASCWRAAGRGRHSSTWRRSSVLRLRPPSRVPLATARSISRRSACMSAWSERAIIAVSFTVGFPHLRLTTFRIGYRLKAAPEGPRVERPMSGNASPHDPLAVGAGAFAPLWPHMLEPLVTAHFATASLHFGTNSQTIPEKQNSRRFDSNNEYWMAATNQEMFVSQQVGLTRFAVMEWYPRCPGLYHTPQAKWERENAWAFVLEQNRLFSGDETCTIFDPYGKACMLNGGIGAIRLRPIDLGGSRLHMMTASSTGVCHEGVPIGCTGWFVWAIDQSG